MKKPVKNPLPPGRLNRAGKVDGRFGPKPNRRKTPNRQSKHDWQAVETKYISGFEKVGPGGEVIRTWPGQIELAALFGVDIRSLAYRCAQGGWVAKREAFRAEVAQKARELHLQKIAEGLVDVRVKAFENAQKGLDQADIVLDLKGLEPEDKAGSLKAGLQSTLLALDIAERSAGVKALPPVPGVVVVNVGCDWAQFGEPAATVVVEAQPPPVLPTGEVTR